MAKKDVAGQEKGKAKPEGGTVGIVELIEEVADVTGTTKVAAGETVRATIDAIAGHLAKKRKVLLQGSFSLVPVKRAARTGRNPQDPTKTINIPEHWSLKAAIGKNLKDAMNAK